MATKNFEGINHECIRSGQKGAYGDHEAVYKITVEEGNDYSEEDIDEAIEIVKNRNRKFGGK